MLSCPTCDAKIPAADVNVMALVAKCVPCDNVFRFEPELLGAAADAEPPRPKAMSVVHAAESPILARTYRASDAPVVRAVTVTRRWVDAGVFFSVLFCAVWDAIMIFAIFGALTSGEFGALLFMSLHIAVGVGATYTTAASVFNRTRVELDQASIHVRHTPIPWRGNLTLPTRGVATVKSVLSDLKVNQQRRFHVVARRDDATEVVIVKNLPEDQARYMAWALRSALEGR